MKYWIKAWVEILNDSKMATLPDRLWRRAMEMFLAAGHYDQEGQLPDTSQLAWLLRISTDELEIDLKQLAASTGILEKTATGWMVTKFAKRQAATPGAERIRQHRERKVKQESNDPSNIPSNGFVTKSYQNRTEQNRTESEQNRTESESLPPPLTPFISPAKILADASGLSTFPPRQLHYAEVIQSLVEDYGVEKTTAALKGAHDKWVSTRGKSGQPYRSTNLGWIDWAQDNLLSVQNTNGNGWVTQEQYEDMLREKYKDEL